MNRLYELGLIPGAEVQLFAKVAFGGPIAISLRGSRLALRRQDAECIGVRTLTH
jgi:ferrous iron transport protein A